MATRQGKMCEAEVLRAAARSMVRKGYGGTSISDLAKAVGMTKAGVYHRTNNKQDMLFSILHHAMETLERELIEPAKRLPEPQQYLREIIRRQTRDLFDHGLKFALLFPERRHLEASQRKVIHPSDRNYLGLLRGTMRELADKRKLKDLGINIAPRHILQTIAGIERWLRQANQKLQHVGNSKPLAQHAII